MYEFLVTTLVLVPLSALAAAPSVPAVWSFVETVEITGEQLRGDRPEYKKLCIAPQIRKIDKTCYGEDDYDPEIEFDTWTETRIVFDPPNDLPAEGGVTLEHVNEVEKCFGSAGCVTTTEDAQIELGSFKAKPFIVNVADLRGSQEWDEPAQSIRKGGRYVILGTYFGEGGDVYLIGPRGSRKVDKGDILEWSPKSVTLALDSSTVEEGVRAVSVNNSVIGSDPWPVPTPTAARSTIVQPEPEASSSPASVSRRFTDVAEAHPYATAIAWAKAAGILQGYPDGSFQPDRIVNRAEFLKIVLAARGGQITGSSITSGFRDVDENGWYAPYVRYAKDQGIVEGYPDGSFRPEQSVNFAEALKIAYETLGVHTDETGGQWYERYLRHAQANDVLYNRDPVLAQGMSRKDVVWIVWKLMTHDGPWKPVEAEAPIDRSPASRTSISENTAQAAISAHCADEWPTDSEMRAYCEDEQQDAVRTLNAGKPADILQSQFEGIRASCTDEWRNDYAMRGYCEQEQFDAIRLLNLGRPEGVSPGDFDTVRRLCESEWPADYTMRVYCESEKLKSLR